MNIITKNNVVSFLSCVIACVLVLAVSSCSSDAVVDEEAIPMPDVAMTLTPVSYQNDIQPIFNKRCVSCHSCFDAPAQLNLSCADGVLRGATKKIVYDGARLLRVQPTRMHVDGTTEEEWRNLGFFSVLSDHDAETATERLRSSILYQMIAQARFKPVPMNSSVQGLVKDTHDPATAPTLKELPQFFKDYPHAGMPYFTEGLTDEEFGLISNWIAQGSPIEKQLVSMSAEEQVSVQQWEAFLNQSSKKSQLTARYLYEHLFISHLYFDDIPETGYYKIVRSKTEPGRVIDPVVTRLPNDHPGVERVYYRLKKMHGIIKRKTHIAYPLSNEKLTRLNQLFINAEWDVKELPGYSNGLKVNPFKVFTDIPADIRYRYLLDNAYHFVLTFIRGPVCRGQNALNAINDNFYILFQNPDSPLAMTNDEFMQKNVDNLKLPGNIMKLLGFPVTYNRITSSRNSYLHNQRRYLDNLYSSEKAIGLSDLWMGSNKESTPLLTVYRHFDTASLVPGFAGATPDTTWVLDYPLLERIYYSLVANFDIFSPVAHQAATRKYFDLLRHEAENNFLHYLPVKDRQSLQNQWYRGVVLKGVFDYHKPSQKIQTSISYDEGEPVKEFIHQVQTKAHQKGQSYPASSFFRVVESIPASAAPFVQFFPEVIYVRVTNPAPKEDEIFTLVRNKAHTNVAFIFGEESRREPERDTLHVITGITGDYPNFMLVVPHDEVDDFQSAVYGAVSEADIDAVGIKYGILRNSPSFWEHLEWFQQQEESRGHYYMGLFDLKNYIIH